MGEKIKVPLDFVITLIEDTCKEYVAGKLIDCDDCKYKAECDKIRKCWESGIQ